MAAASLSTQLSFDYGDLPSAEQKALERHAENVLKINRALTKNVIAIGAELSEARSRLSNHGNGTFGKWCEQRCGISRQHALRLIGASDVFGTKRLEHYVPNFDATAMYRLSADTCPEAALDDCLKLARKGEFITAKRAQQIIDEHTVDEGESESGDADDDTASATGWSGEFDDATAIDMTRSYIKGQFAQWPAKRRKLFLDQLRQIVNELDDPQLLTAENIEW